MSQEGGLLPLTYSPAGSAHQHAQQDAACSTSPSTCVHLPVNVMGEGVGWGGSSESSPCAPQGLLCALLNQVLLWFCKWASFQPCPCRPHVRAQSSGALPRARWWLGAGQMQKVSLSHPDQMCSDSRLVHDPEQASLTLRRNPGLRDPWASLETRFPTSGL